MEQKDPDKPDFEERINPIVGAQMELFFGHPDPLVPGRIVNPDYFDEAEYYRTSIEQRLIDLRQDCEDHGIPFMALATFARKENPADETTYQEDFIMITTDPANRRTGHIQRGVYAVCTDTNTWTIGPSILMAQDLNLKDLLGGL